MFKKAKQKGNHVGSLDMTTSQKNGRRKKIVRLQRSKRSLQERGEERKKKKTGTSREKKKIYEMINQNMKRGNIKNKEPGPTKNGLGFFLNYFSPFRPVYMPEYTLRNMCNTSRLPCNRPRKVEIQRPKNKKERGYIYFHILYHIIPGIGSPSFSFLVPTNQML